MADDTRGEAWLKAIEARHRAATAGPFRVEKSVHEDSVHYWIRTAQDFVWPAEKSGRPSPSPRFLAWMSGSLGEARSSHLRFDPNDYRDDGQILADATFLAFAWADVAEMAAALRAAWNESRDLRGARAALDAASVEAESLGLVRGVESLREWIGGYVRTLKGRLALAETRCDELTKERDHLRTALRAALARACDGEAE